MNPLLMICSPSVKLAKAHLVSVVSWSVPPFHYIASYLPPFTSPHPALTLPERKRVFSVDVFPYCLKEWGRFYSSQYCLSGVCNSISLVVTRGHSWLILGETPLSSASQKVRRMRTKLVKWSAFHTKGLISPTSSCAGTQLAGLGECFGDALESNTTNACTIIDCD